jgi:hypothetical protein
MASLYNYDGKEPVYSCGSTREEVRNLYIMMAAASYAVDEFLTKLNKGEFGESFGWQGKGTPPKLPTRYTPASPLPV